MRWKRTGWVWSWLAFLLSLTHGLNFLTRFIPNRCNFETDPKQNPIKNLIYIYTVSLVFKGKTYERIVTTDPEHNHASEPSILYTSHIGINTWCYYEQNQKARKSQLLLLVFWYTFSIVYWNNELPLEEGVHWLEQNPLAVEQKVQDNPRCKP